MAETKKYVVRGHGQVHVGEGKFIKFEKTKEEFNKFKIGYDGKPDFVKGFAIIEDAKIAKKLKEAGYEVSLYKEPTKEEEK